MNNTLMLEACYQHYQNQAEIKSPHTLAAYARAIVLFFDFLGDHKASDNLPIRSNQVSTPQQLLSTDFVRGDVYIFEAFAKWLLSSYAPSTVELRVAGVLHWFQYMQQQNWLSSEFPLDEASEQVHQLLKLQRDNQAKAITSVEDLERVVYYYDTQLPPKTIRTNSEQFTRWEVKRLRNRSLLHCLAETGGRISELLGLDVAVFAQSDLKKQLMIAVRGKGGYHYQLRLKDALPAIRDYLNMRSINPQIDTNIPLFVSHDPRYEGSRMSRIVGWRVVHRAANAFGIADVSPHDFRHWRAVELIRQGHSLQAIQEILGHRSIETVRSLYAHFEAQSEQI